MSRHNLISGWNSPNKFAAYTYIRSRKIAESPRSAPQASIYRLSSALQGHLAVSGTVVCPGNTLAIAGAMSVKFIARTPVLLMDEYRLTLARSDRLSLYACLLISLMLGHQTLRPCCGWRDFQFGTTSSLFDHSRYRSCIMFY